MDLHLRKMLIIVAEATLEKPLIRDARDLGALGYTVHDVRGGGMNGVREGAWEADRSIEMKVVCEETVALRIAEHVLQTYGPHYALTVFIADARVFRAHKF